MKEFVSHIDYLIQKHDCVIIPEFGGFVLSREGASFAKDGSVLPPKITVGFNPQLRSNDGLLAESYMTMYSVTYDVACKNIGDAVVRLNTILEMKHPVQMGRLGKLSLDKNNRMSFSPNENLSIFHPETFGLFAVRIQRLSDLEKNDVLVKRKSTVRRILASVGASAAALLVFFVASTPISENTNTQKSSFFTDLIPSNSQLYVAPEPSIDAKEASVSTLADVAVEPVAKVKIEEEVVEQQTKIAVEKVSSTPPASEKEVVSEKKKEAELGNASTKKYFVIIGSGASMSEAEKLLAKFKSQGYTDADIVSSGNRNRIYVTSFEQKSEAEAYLVTLKSKNPKLSDAWVYFKN